MSFVGRMRKTAGAMTAPKKTGGARAKEREARWSAATSGS